MPIRSLIPQRRLPLRLLLSAGLLLNPLLRGGQENGETIPRATAVLPLTIERAIAMALDRNLTVKVESFSPQISQENLFSASGVFDPTLEISYTRGEVRDLLVEPDLHVETHDFDAGLTGLTPWGLSYSAGISSFNNRDSSEGSLDNYSISPAFGLAQPLLRGFGTSANMAGIRIARGSLAISEWSMRQTVIDTVTDVIRTYNDLHLAREGLRVAIRSRGLAAQTFQDNARRAEIGVMSPLDVTQARAEVAAREERVIVAERLVRDQENFLKQLVTDDVEKLLRTQVEIVPPSPPAQLAIDVPQGITVALEWRPDYQQALFDLRTRNIVVAQTQNAALPRLDLVASLSYLGADGAFGSSFDSVLDRDSRSWSAGAVFSMPLGNRSRRGDANAARLSAAQGLVDLKRLEQSIVVAVDNAAGQVRTTIQRINSTREARLLAEETLDAAQQRLQAGTGTTFEVLDFQEKLATAEVSELRAVADYHIAVAEYHRQTGTTLQFNRITFAPLPRENRAENRAEK
jgi:outer membrane protein TolC